MPRYNVSVLFVDLWNKYTSMKQNEEHTWISDKYKGEYWSLVENELENNSNFIKQETYVYKSLETGEVYKFILLGSDSDAFVSRIEVQTEFGFKPISSSLTDKDNLIRKYELLESNKRPYLSNLKRNIIDTLCSSCSLNGFTALLNRMDYYPAIQELKTYLGMKPQQEFFSIQFLELDFENYGGLLCKVVRRKPSVEHRVIKTPCGNFYAVPIKGTFEDLVDCLISFKTLSDIIGFQGIIDNYREDL